MAKSLFTWSGRVALAEDWTQARAAFGIPDGIKATIYDITPGLREIIFAELGGGRRG
jgi:hypothetical protein